MLKDDSMMSCRICLEDNKPLISPCNCKGTAAFVHRECLETWINTSGKHHCEICLEDFETESVAVRHCDGKRCVVNISLSPATDMRRVIVSTGMIIFFVLNMCLLIGFDAWLDTVSFMNICVVLFIVIYNRHIDVINTGTYLHLCLFASAVISYVVSDITEPDAFWIVIFEGGVFAIFLFCFFTKLACIQCTVYEDHIITHPNYEMA